MKSCEIKSKSATPSCCAFKNNTEASKKNSIYRTNLISTSTAVAFSLVFFFSRFNETCRCTRSCDHYLRLRSLSNDSVCTFVLVLTFVFHGFFFRQRCLALKVSVSRKSEVCHFNSRIIVTQTSACMHHPPHFLKKKLYLICEAINHTTTITPHLVRLNQVRLELKESDTFACIS